MSEIRVGKFLSRDIDTQVMRSGRSGVAPQRVVFWCNDEGQPVSEVCRVSFPTDVPHPVSVEKLQKVMRALDAGVSAINS